MSSGLQMSRFSRRIPGNWSASSPAGNWTVEIVAEIGNKVSPVPLTPGGKVSNWPTKKSESEGKEAEVLEDGGKVKSSGAGEGNAWESFESWGDVVSGEAEGAKL